MTDREAEVQRLMRLAERLRAEAMAMGSFPDDAQAGRVEVARAALESALRELLPAGWAPIETRPGERSTYLLANAKGQVAPCINGIIHNNVGTRWDWDYGEPTTHWMPLPAAPSTTTAPAPQPSGVARLREAVEELMRHQLTGTRDGMHALTRLVDAADAVCGRVPADARDAWPEVMPAAIGTIFRRFTDDVMAGRMVIFPCVWEEMRAAMAAPTPQEPKP